MKVEVAVPGFPVPNNPHGLCGRIATLEVLSFLVECCFTSTETVGLLGTGAQDGHLDFHTAPELCTLPLRHRLFSSICQQRHLPHSSTAVSGLSGLTEGAPCVRPDWPRCFDLKGNVMLTTSGDNVTFFTRGYDAMLIHRDPTSSRSSTRSDGVVHCLTHMQSLSGL